MILLLRTIKIIFFLSILIENHLFFIQPTWEIWFWKNHEWKNWCGLFKINLILITLWRILFSLLTNLIQLLHFLHGDKNIDTTMLYWKMIFSQEEISTWGLVRERYHTMFNFYNCHFFLSNSIQRRHSRILTYQAAFLGIIDWCCENMRKNCFLMLMFSQNKQFLSREIIRQQSTISTFTSRMKWIFCKNNSSQTTRKKSCIFRKARQNIKRW